MKFLGKTSFLKARGNFFLFFLYSILLYMKKFSNAVNNSNKFMLTYFSRAVFKNLYFKTKHSNETFHLGFYSLSNVFSYRKHIKSQINISILTISGKIRDIKIIAPYPPTIVWYNLNILWGSFYYEPPSHFKIFFRNTHPLLIWPLSPSSLSH